MFSSFLVVQSLSQVWLFATPWTAALQASLSFTIFRSLLKLMSVELMKPFNHLILCCPLLLLPSVFPSIRVFSRESALCIKWPKVSEFQLPHQYFQWVFRVDFLWDWLVWPPIPKKGNTKECSNYETIALTSHASKVMLKILQARLQKDVNWEILRCTSWIFKR